MIFPALIFTSSKLIFLGELASWKWKRGRFRVSRFSTSTKQIEEIN